MVRDSERRPSNRHSQDNETGATKERTGRQQVPNQSTGDNENSDSLHNLRIIVINEVLEVNQQQSQVTEQVEPKQVVEQQQPSSSNVDTESFSPSRVGTQVTNVVQPTQQISRSGGVIHIPTVSEFSLERVSQSVQSRVRPTQFVEKRDRLETLTVSEFVIGRRDNQVTNQLRPEHDRTQEQKIMQRQNSSQAVEEVDDIDPVFDWVGGSPYGSGRPKLILHRSQDDVETLSFLQVLLRDTYKELEGGEPGAETVEFVANEPRIPQVQKNIVTLDLTGTEWSSSVRNGEPVIERNNLNIVPKLREVATTLYTGKLGYFVVNIPDAWEGAILQDKFFEKLLSDIAGSSLQEDENKGIFELLESSPVVVAEPCLNNEQALVERTGQYFCIHELDLDQNTSVKQIEAVGERWLRRDDWKRIALTERQKHADESDEHFFWKAAIAEGITWSLYKQYRQNVLRSDEDISFEEFIQMEVIPADWFQTEKEMGGNEKSGTGVIADLSTTTESPWIGDAVAEFISDDIVSRGEEDIVVEFETGRGEGAFNFRKLRESLEKYQDIDNPSIQLCIVVPSRLLFQGKQRAHMIVKLIETWNENPDHEFDAEVFVPILESGYCRKLQRAEVITEQLYGGESTDE